MPCGAVHVSAALVGGERLLEFGILGPLEIFCGGRPVEIRREKERALLAMLLLHPGEVVSLDHLALGLWEDAAPRPPATLRVHVSRLRQGLGLAHPEGEVPIVTTARGYALELGADAVDAGRFERLAAEGRRLLADDPVSAADHLARALDLWRGPVLSDLSLSPAVEPEIARLDEARLAALEDRVDADIRCGRHHELSAELDRLVSEHPLRERLWGQLMVALYRAGRQADALRAYEELRVLLRDELGIRPSPPLQQLEQAILDQDPVLVPPVVQPEGGGAALGAPAPPPGADEPAGLFVRFPGRLLPEGLIPFAGRRAQVDSLFDAWKECTAGSQRVVLVSGEAGIGKTRLAAEAARRVHEAGGAVLFGRCDEEMHVPFQPFVEALEQFLAAGPVAADLGPHAGELTRLLPDLAGGVAGLAAPLHADPETERYRLFDAVGGWLAAASADYATMLVLDDLQWAARPTLMLLRHLVRSPAPMRLVVVGTYRDTDLGASHPLAAVLADLRREPHVTRVSLSGLEPDEVDEMLAAAGPYDSLPRGADLGRALWSETDGNPFFVQELYRSRVERGEAVAGAGLAVPEGVREVVGRRVGRLGDATGKVLSAASVIGAAVDFDVVAAVTGLDEEQVLDALDEATGASLMRETRSGGYEFVHGLVRSTLYEALGAARRARRHRQVGEALESLGRGDAAVLANHFVLSGDGDRRAVDYAAQAAEKAIERLSFDQAVGHYTMAFDAAERAGVGAARICELQIGLGTAQRLAAVPAYRETLLAAAAAADELGEAELLARAVLANSRGFASAAGVLDEERVRFIEAALDRLPDSDSEQRARLSSLLALELTWQDPELRRIPIAEEAVAMARRIGDEMCLLEVLLTAHVACALPERTQAMVEQLPEVVALAERVGDPLQLVRTCFAGAVECLQMGDAAQAAHLASRVADTAAELGHPVFKWMDAHQRCRTLSVTGTGDEIERGALEALQLGQEAGQPDLLVWFSAQLYAARWAQGRLGEMVGPVRGVMSATPGLSAWKATLALGLAAVGERDEAAAIVSELIEGRSGLARDLAWLSAQSVLAEAVAAVGTPEQAAIEYEVLEPFAGRIPSLVNVARPGVHLWLGALASLAGWPERAEAHFEAAHEQHEQLGAPVWLARTELEWGRHLASSGEGDRARRMLESARARAEAASAAGFAESASELLATLAGG
jgi:DNA-binding SARP family transcriptional activator